ncbi:4-oxalocrotonate tautomerase family protein [Sulfitobacter albidus]|uniref:4-oxalocrotonate tautomerase family protein n=1 Tax=Sulfitobacter albidus TaxID=2829501 RepID=A0A975JGR9_9RHOB|nr:4-oxalocrotonate tautomerase family protein [Sulfitobacter albidus]QUJ78234.1 4-oxalocrotonate tautomerase family protein [Sulfitobacter albidus]
MPFVNIRIVKQVIEHDPEGIKAQVQASVTDALSHAAQIPQENVWVTFEEIDETDWFAGGQRVKEIRANS